MTDAGREIRGGPESPGGRPEFFEDESKTQAAPAVEMPPTRESGSSDLEALQREGMEVEARTQWQLARRRFFRHKLAVWSIVALIIIFVASLAAPLLTPYEPLEINLEDTSLGPTAEGRHVFGTDLLGRDYFTRVLYGIRTTARVAFLVAGLSTVIGVI